MAFAHRRTRTAPALVLFAWRLLLAGPAVGQAPPVADGLKADYYQGVNFERFVLSRRDATINFTWGQQPPAPGVPAESFSVRWTGWLVPPTTGRYVFHVTVDDGMRIWVNNRLILNEWRGQPLSTYTAAIKLTAGEPYHLRVDYCQYGLDSRAVVTWEQPQALKAESSWRNAWGLAASRPGPNPIPTRYLFSRSPRPASPPTGRPVPPALAARQSVPAAQVPKPLGAPAPKAAAPQTIRAVHSPAATSPRTAPPAAAPAAAADSGSTAQLARLAVGEAVVLPDLYFNQGQALLLPAARTTLDDVAARLTTGPGLRFEVQGHTDNVGSAELNRQLSQQRADAVCLYLVAHGVAAEQLRPVGYGGTQPVADNADPAQRPRNRRVVLRRL